jgi:hypothetical protein
MSSAIEYRAQRFQELSNNKWYYLMNYVIDTLVHKVRFKDRKEGRMYKPDMCFYGIDRSLYRKTKLRFGQKTAEN